MEGHSKHIIEIDQASFAQSFGMKGIRELNHELKWGNHCRRVMTHFRQEQAARRLHGSAGGTVRPIEDLGTPMLNVDANAYHYWGVRLGYDCWDDDQFLREFHRDNEMCRVKEDTGNTVVLVERRLKPKAEAQAS